jgi:nitrous oxidase accessory protein NosD
LTSSYTAAAAPVINTKQTKGYPTIQAAIDDAGDCNTITVAPGTYYEVLQISKPLTLLGPNAGIAGYGERNPEAVITYPAGTEEEKSVRVTSDDVTIKGFYFQGDDRTIGNLEAIYARGNDLTVNNNVFDGYVLTQVRTYPVSSKEGFNEGLLIEGNLFKNKPVGNFALYVQGTSGDVKLNKFENVRHGLTIQPYHHSVGGRVEHNEVEAWRMGVWFNGAYVRSGEWVFDNNTITATEKPSEAEDTVWWGLTIETFGDGGPLVNGDLPSATFTNNTVDGAGASPEVETRGLSFHQPVKSDKLTINNNTFTNVDVGAYIHNPDGTEFMVIKLDDFFPSNTFPEGSMVIGHRILVPQNNTVYNMRSGAEYSDIQAAIDAATAGDTILVAPGTYVGNLEIDVVDLTLKSAEQHAAVIQTVSGFAAGNGYGGITVLADGVTIDGFRIEQGAAQAVIHTHDSDGVTIQNNQVVGLNGVNPRGIDVGYASAASDGVTIQYNEFEDLYCGVYVNKGTDLTIDDNEFVNMVDGAVVFDGTWPIGDVAVTNNTATDAGYLMYFYGGADSVQVDDNTLDNTELTNWGVYNLTQKRYSSTLQDAITRAEDEDTIEVVAGTYHEFLVIDKPITLLGPNAGVAGYSSERDEEAIITVPSGTDIEDPGSDTSSVITVNAPNVTIDGFRITGDNGNGLNDYAGYNIQAGNAITGYEDGLVVKNNVIDCFSYIGVKTSRTVNEVRVEQISNVSIKSNYFAHIHDLNQVGYGYALYVQGASGTIIGNVVKDSRTAIQVQPYGASGGGLVKDNVFEAYRLGAYYNYAERTAGPWVFENNSITAIAPPAAMAGPIAWDGIVVQTIGTHGDANSVPGIVTFTKNNIDGSATSSTDLNRLAVNGVRIIPSVDTDAVMVFGENTISGVEIGFQLDSGDLDLDMVLERNTFATGSKVIGHRILVPQQSTIYNMRSGAEYSDIQKAVDEAESNDTLLVTAGTYEEDLLIDVDDLTLVGPNADVPGNGTRAAEATIHGTVRIAADDVVLSGFSIENDGNTVIVNVDGSSGAMIQNNIVMQLNFQTAGNPCIGNLDISGTNSITIDNNLIQGSIGLYPTAAADVVITKNVIDNAPAEAIWLWGAGGSQQDYTLTISGNEVREFNLFELGNISAVKLVTKPASVNEKTQTSDIFDVIEEANEFDSVNLEWMTGVHNTTQDEFYSTIQEAIDEAADGEEITVAAGTYDEAVVVNKPLTLLGANSNVNPNTGERGEETVLTDRLTLTGDNVIAVDGFKFLNETFGENNQTAVAINGNGTYTVVNSVFERNNGKPKEELAGEEPLAIRGIEISAASSGSIDIQNNLFTGSAVDVYSNSSWNSAIYLNGGQQAVTIKDNVFEVSRTALNLDDFSNAITVTGNTFGSGNGTHISFGGTTPTSGSYSISGNDFAVVGAVFNLSKVDPAFRLDATGNTFDGKAPTEMSEEELFVLESLIWHKGKGGRNGFVRVLEDKVFVTTQSGTIAQAIAVAESGDTVRVAAGTYPENLTINKTLTLVGTGDDESGTILSPASGRIITLTAGGNAEGDRLTIKGIRLANGDSNGIFTDSTISHITIEDVTVTNMQSYGITIHNHAVVSDLKLNNVTVNDCSVGLRVRGSLNGLAVTDSSFDGNREGLSSVLPESDGDGTYLTHVTISDTTFNGNSRKGMYLEKLSDALFEGIEVVNSGTEVGYDYSTGVDINLKFAGYQNITIKDSKISGASNGAAGHGLAIKARDDGSYANNRATLTNVRIERVELTDNYNGILISGSITEPVVIVECVIKNIGFELGNLSTTSVTAIENWWGSERVEDIAAKVYGTVQYNPWYVDTSLTKLCTEAAVELVNATDDETEMQAVLRSNKVALDLDLSAYDNSLTEIGRLRVAVAMVAGRDYDSIQDVQDAFKNAVRVQELLVPINTASTPAGMMKAIDENGEELGLPDSYFDWTEPYQLQVAEVVLNSRRLGGYANAEALLAVVNPVVDDLAEEANAVVEVNDAANMAEIREALEAKAAILGLSTGDGSDYAALPEAYKNRVAQTMLAGEPYPDKTAIASAFEAAVVAEKAEADAVNVVNNATTSAEMGAALVDNAAALGLDLDDFHNLLEYYRGVVLEQLLGPEYADAAAIRVAVGAAVDTVKTESAAVAAVNAAADVAAMGAALDALGLDLTDYNTLVAYYQNEVARLMLDSVPYANKADVETAFADAVSQQMVTSAAVAAVNDAGNWQTMKVTLKDNEQALGLNMSAYDDLSSTEQNLVAAIMVAQRPANGYANHVQIQEMFTQAMAEVTGNGIAGMQALLGEEFDK